MQLTAEVDFGRGLTDAWSRVATFVPKLIIFLVILLVGLIVAKALKKTAERVLWRLGFDRAVERGGLKAVLARTKVDPSELIARLVYYAAVLITLQLAFGVWGPNNVSRLLDEIVSFLPKVALAVVIVVITSAVARSVREVITAVLGDLSYGPLLGTAASGVVLLLGIVAALDQVGIVTTVTRPVLIAVLATIGGILVVGVGGGLIRPLTHRWEGWLGMLEREAGTIRHEVAIRRSAALPSDEDSPPWRASPPPEPTKPPEPAKPP
ncbi:MAG: hypothetical protein ABJA34_04405 [Pseudonocardiales bacterium]